MILKILQSPQLYSRDKTLNKGPLCIPIVTMYDNHGPTVLTIITMYDNWAHCTNHHYYVG